MTADALRQQCMAQYGTSSWHGHLAEDLGVNRRTVRRWASGSTPIPHWLDRWLEEQKALRSAASDLYLAYPVCEHTGYVDYQRPTHIRTRPRLAFTSVTE